MTFEVLTEIPQSIIEFEDDVIAPGFAELNELAKIDGIEKRVIVVREGDTINACAICYVENRRHHGLFLKVYALFGYLLHDYCRIMCKSTKAWEMLKHAATQDARQQGCDIIIWSNIPKELVPDETLPVHTDIKLYTATESEQGWGRFYKSKHVKYLLNKVKKINGNYKVEIINGFVPDYLMNDLAQRHIQRWRFAGSGSPFASNSHRIDEYRINPTNKHYLRIYAGDELIACHYGMKYGDTLLFHTPIINPKYLELSPMKLILAETAKYCEANGITSIDFGHGDEAYKDGYCTLPRLTCNYNKTLTAKGLIAQSIGRTNLKDSIFFNKPLKIINQIKSSFRKNKVREYYIHRTTQNYFDSSNAIIINNWQEFCDISERLKVDIYKWQFNRFHKEKSMYIGFIEDNQCKANSWIQIRENTKDNTPNSTSMFYLSDVWYSSDHALKTMIDKALSISNNTIIVLGDKRLHNSLTSLGY